MINHRLTLDTQSHDLSEAEVNNEFEYIVDRMFKGMQRGKEFDGFLEAVLDVLKEEQAENNYLMLKWDELLIAFNNFMKRKEA